MVQSCSRSKQLHNCIVFLHHVARGQRPLEGSAQATRFTVRNACSLILRVQQLSSANRLEFTRALCKAGERSSSYSLFSLVPSAQLWNVAWRDVSRTEWFILYGFPVELERDFRHQNDKIVRPGASRLSPICSPNERGRATASEIGKLLDLVEVVYTRREVVLVLGLG